MVHIARLLIGEAGPTRTYVPTHALWGCRAEHVTEDDVPITRLYFPKPLAFGEQAHFVSETVQPGDEDDPRGWADVSVDSYGIVAGELRDGVVPAGGLTIRVMFDDDVLPAAVWWYAGY